MIRARLVLTSMTLGSSLASFTAYTLLLQFLGASAQVDLLFYAASVPMAIAGMASGVCLYLLPPRLTQVSSQQQLAASRFLWAAVAGLTGVGVIITLGLAPFVKDSRFAWLLAGFILTGGLAVQSTIGVCLAQARGTYLPSGTTPLAASTGLLLGALAAIWWRREWLLLVGQLAGTSVSVWLGVRGLGVGRRTLQRRTWRIGVAALAPLREHATAIALGTLAFALFQPIDAALCTRLQAGSVSVMAYSLRVVVATGTAISLGAFAIAARTSRDAYLAGGLPALQSMANREVARIMGFGIALWLAYVLGGDLALVTLFSASHMPAADVTRLRDCLGIMLLAAGPMTAVPYLFRLFYSMADYRRPAVIGAFVPPLYGGIAWLLLPSQQILGLAYSFAAVWWLAFAASVLWINASGSPFIGVAKRAVALK